MEEMGMKAKDLEPLIGSKGHVSSVLSGRREITLKMAQKLKDTPKESKFIPIWNFIKSNKSFACVIILLIIALLILAILRQTQVDLHQLLYGTILK